MLEAIGAQGTQYIPPQTRILNNDEAALVWLLRWAGDPDHVIAAKLGTMPTKVSGILSEKTHVGSREMATRMAGFAR